jgi:hypothetical protein
MSERYEPPRAEEIAADDCAAVTVAMVTQSPPDDTD